MHWRTWQPTPVFLPGESQGRGSLVGCRLWGCTESDTTEQLSSSSSVCICQGSIPGSGRSSGEGNGNSLQYSCLENLTDREAWWGTVYRVERVGHDSTTNTHTHTCVCVCTCVYICIYIIELVLYFPYMCLCRKYNPKTILIHITLIFQTGTVIITSQL